ncbi:Protein of unknown function [Gryllus bimaculatus]|nr:Protein of unknown function [Gryllus bimaculatus]
MTQSDLKTNLEVEAEDFRTKLVQVSSKTLLESNTTHVNELVQEGECEILVARRKIRYKTVPAGHWPSPPQYCSGTQPRCGSPVAPGSQAHTAPWLAGVHEARRPHTLGSEHGSTQRASTHASASAQSLLSAHSRRTHSTCARARVTGNVIFIY